MLATKVIRDAAFAQRLATALESNPNVPNVYHQKWLVDQFKKIPAPLGEVSAETVRKWYRGEVRPRPDRMKALARILEIDEAWLSIGRQPDLQPREQKLRDATADGAVNVVAGLVQIGGSTPAFPTDKDARAKAAHIDLYAIIKGAQYGFHVSLAQPVGEKYCFVVPSNHEEAFQVGVVLSDSLSLQLVEITDDLIREKGVRKGSGFEVVLASKEIDDRRITSFRDRL